MRILIVEDEYNLADAMKFRLKNEKYIVDIETNGDEGLYSALSGIYDLIILDVMIPNVSGFEILSQIRKNNIDSKVIMVTAKSMIDDKLNGFNLGANDYLTKPFHMDELVARVNVQLKNNNNVKDKNIIEYADLMLNISNSKLTCIKTNESVELVCKEFQLLEYFMNNSEQILSKEQIYDKIWGIENISSSNNLEAYLSFLRKKIKAIGSCVNIKSVRGLGYRMEKVNEKIKK
jgi:DNA-binding response OmpR family regulator